MSKSPYIKIMRAAKRGTGCRLTADDVRVLSSDDAIATRAENDAEGKSYDGSYMEDHCPDCEQPESECVCDENS